MYKHILFMIITLLITNCIFCNHKKKDVRSLFLNNQQNYNCSNLKNQKIHSHTEYDYYIYHYAKNYNVDAILIKSIIQVESNYDPSVVSKSNAVGLMQIKADAAGKDAYRLKGWNGQPSVYDLKNAAINIELGTAYLSILQQQLQGIKNKQTRRYAMIVSYVNGLGALFKMFSVDRVHAINKINKLNSEQFYQYVKYNHPSEQAQRYLSKVNTVYIFQNRVINQ